MTEPGWYKDPVDPEVQRYWDGEGWLGEPIPASEPAPDGPPEGAEAPDWARKPTASAPSDSSSSGSASGSEEATSAGGPAAPVAWPPSAPWTPGPGMPDPGTPASDAPASGASGSAAPAAWTSPVKPGTPLPQGAVVLPPGTPVPPGGFKPGQLPPGAIILPPGTPLPPGLMPQGSVPSGAVQVLLPPQIALAGQGVVKPHGRAIAGLGSRLLARLIDIAIVGLLNAAVTGWFIYQWLQEVAPYWREYYHRLQNEQSTGDLVAPERQGYLQVVILILIAALWFAYEVPSIANNGQTVGKRLLKIKVMRLESEEPLGFGRAIRRWNPLGLSVLLWTCGVGFLLQFLDSLSPVIDWPLHRAFHDRSAGTVVVAADPVPTPTEPAGEPR
ncbi:RDD family protein [Dactylosporangium sucinum]|uniref:RDD domain-containing protein n=1 Tax=Dactylosporangium sucinum TaxID=1424081 RepID=A0A917TVA6_9ACTN|nr:RDD family protein [Dactylosporangium sucinum]GGM39658.1 hypothetical protein GCM10007977_046330 [Dactylosporangium sucinum]